MNIHQNQHKATHNFCHQFAMHILVQSSGPVQRLKTAENACALPDP